MRIRRSSHPAPSRLSIPSSPSKVSTKRNVHHVRCIVLTLTISLAIAWSMGVLCFLATMHSDTLTTSPNVNQVTSIQREVNNNLPKSPNYQVSNLRSHSTDTSQTKSRQHFQLQQSSTWSWPIIHIVSTRFMQGQGSLVSLGRSRLKLLEIICLPSIVKQSILQKETLELVYNHTPWKRHVNSLEEERLYNGYGVDPLFLWVIKVDPDLDPILLEELRVVLQPVENYTIVVGSDVNYGIGIKPGGWRDGQSGSLILEALSNNLVYFPQNTQYAKDLITRAHESRLDRVILETRLDADDAIHLNYFSVLYYTALKNLMTYPKASSGFIMNDDDAFEQKSDDAVEPQQINNEQDETAKWMYWCPHRHIQWNPSTSFYNPNNDPGMLSVFESPNVCVTPGLTLGFAIGTNESDVPRYEHTHVYWEISHGNFETGDSSQHDCGLIPPTRCAVFMENPFISAFRSRSMTSAGMHMMEALGKPSMDTPKYYTEISNKLWKKHVEEYFGIVPERAMEAADFLMDIYVDTVRDNLRGQCTKGHSCKISSLEKLQRTIDILEEQVNGIDIAG